MDKVNIMVKVHLALALNAFESRAHNGHRTAVAPHGYAWSQLVLLNCVAL